MSQAPIGGNLRRLRQQAGMTQAQAADAAGLSLAGYRKVELSQAVPRAATLRSLAGALGAGVDELVRPTVELERVRFRSQKKLKRRGHVLALVGQRLADYRSLEELLDDRLELGRKLETRRRGVRRSIDAAAEVRRWMGRTETEPIRDICGLLEAHGVKVLTFRLASDGFFGLSIGLGDGGGAVVVNDWDRISVERRIFTAAHELGHLILHLADYGIAEEEEDAEHEKEANAFASHFLMPDAIFWKEWKETRGMHFIQRVLKVKRMFGVSYATVIYRVAEQADEPERLWKMFFAQYKQHYGRSLTKKEEPEGLGDDSFRAAVPPSTSEPENLSPLDFLPERLHRLVRQAVEQELISMDRGAEILGLSTSGMRQLVRAWVE